MLNFNSYLLDLEARIKAYETKAEEASVTPSSVAATSEILDAESVAAESSAPLQLTISRDTDKDDIDKNPLIEGTAHLVLSPGGGERRKYCSTIYENKAYNIIEYLGDSSSTSLGLRFQDFIKTFQSELNNGIEFDAPTQSRTNFSIRRDSFQDGQPKISLPPFAFAKRLYAAQYAYLGTIFSFTDMDLFEESLHEIYDRPVDVSDKDDCLVYCEVLLTLAFGQMYSVNQWTSNDGPPGFEYFQQAMQLLPGLHEQGSVTFIKVLSLVGYFFQNLNRRDAAFLYVSDNLFHVVLSNMDRLAWHCVWPYQWGYIRRFPIRISTTGLENIGGDCGGLCTAWIGR
jgi:proline utilization trans-activator